ncbi:TVP38/TMEM64 family protein [Heliomicrobium modesticaldum]|nr:VTT domain-containing protein [Heliomicrobium modesticaldum]
MRYKTLFLFVALMALPLAATAFGFDLKGAVEWMRAQGPWAFFFTVPAHILLSISPMSSDPVALTNGFIYGTALGAAANWLGSMGGAVAGYWLIRRSAEEVSLPKHFTKLPRWLRDLPVASPLFLIGVRMIPFIGGDIVKFMAPLYRVPFARYLWTQAVAIAPWAVFLAAVGAGVSLFIGQ